MGNVINFSTGLEEYEIPGPGGTVKVLLNLTDLAFIEQIFDTFNRMDEKQEEYSKAIEDAKDTNKIFDVLRGMEKEMRAEIDGVLGEGTCQGIFGRMSVYALADGLPLWVNLMLAVIDGMDEGFIREKKATNPRIKKYTEKYKRRAAGR